jgi:hypothetical protein
MDNLKKEIRNLSEITVMDNAYENVEEKLQLLGEMLITNYVIKIGVLKIEPLWVEAYYSNVAKGFADPFIHGKYGKEEQSEFGILYFHHKTDDNRSGVDICLSLCNENKTESKYYLSYLLKYTLVNGEFTTQSQLSAKIRKAYDSLPNKNDIFEISCNKCEVDTVGYTTRIGLNVKDSDPLRDTKKQYASLKLAIAKNFDKTYSAKKKLPHIESLARSFLSTYDSDKEKWCKEHLGYSLKNI